MRPRLSPDAGVGATECNGLMDSFDTWPLIAAPLLGLLVIAATALASALGA